jgi:FkbM family methyltransferase
MKDLNMFTKKRISVDNHEMELTWLEKDQSCFPIISHDWNNYNHFIMKYVKNYESVLQAGGNCGLYPFLYSLTFDKVYTFEPDPLNFRCLAENCISNHIIKFNSAVSDKNAFQELTIVEPTNVGMHKLGEKGEFGVQIYCQKIDSLEIQQLSLLHLDIEGHEPEAINGARETIERCKPVVVLEVGENDVVLSKLMKELNYEEIEEYGSNPINKIYLPKEI